MVRYKVKLAYDGTDFAGYQRQQGVRTVQEVIETALGAIGWQGEDILAAGRTDAGVHAAGQIIAFDLQWGHSEADLQAALNANLPTTVSARSVFSVEPDFHPRYDAIWRQYVYTVICEPIRDPLRERYAWRQWPMLDLEALKASAALLLGQHDFRGFGKALKLEGSTIREVSRACWTREETTFRFTIRANAFLYRMVRRIVFALILVGRGERDPSDIKSILEDPDHHFVQGLAPARGLVLDRILYANDSDTVFTRG